MNIAKALLRGTAIGVIGAGVAVGYMAYKVFKEEESMEGCESLSERVYETAHKVKTKGMEVAALGLDKIVQACDVVCDTVATAGIAMDEIHEDLESEIQLRHITDEAAEDICCDEGEEVDDDDDEVDIDDEDYGDEDYGDDYDDEDECGDDIIDGEGEIIGGEVSHLREKVDHILGKPVFDNLDQARAYDRLLNYLGSFAAVTDYMLQLSHVDSWDYAKALMIYECTHAETEE